MSGLALLCLEAGVHVTGSDLADSWSVRRLRIRGAAISRQHATVNVGNAELVVFSRAIRDDNPEITAARAGGIPCISRGEFLAAIAHRYPCVVAVGGSHGKTTTTAMLAHILREAACRPGYLIGGDVPAWSAPACSGAGSIFVTEVDESDASQTLVESTVAIVLAVDDDHSWNVGGQKRLEDCFREFAARAGTLVAVRTPQTERLFLNHRAVHFVDTESALALPELSVPGEHNRMNAATAVRAAGLLGVPLSKAHDGIQTFPGVARRLTQWFRATDNAVTIIEDYAHHPTELEAALSAIRRMYPSNRLAVVFQPHRIERVQRYARRFAACLERYAHGVTILPTFAAWCSEDASSEARGLADRIRRIPARFIEAPGRELVPHLANLIKIEAGKSPGTTPTPWTIAFVGAGDIQKHIPRVVDFFVTKYKSDLVNSLRRVIPGLAIRQDLAWGDLTRNGIGAGRPVVVSPVTETERNKVIRQSRRKGAAVHDLGPRSPGLVGTDAENLTVVLCNRDCARKRSACEPTVLDPVFQDVGITPAEEILRRTDCLDIAVDKCRLDPNHPNQLLCPAETREIDCLTFMLAVRRRVYDYTGVRLMAAQRFAGKTTESRWTTEPAAPHVAVLKGGPPQCTERETSLKSGAAVAQGLRQAGYHVTEVEIVREALPPLPNDTDIVFPVLHGAFGEDGGIQELLDAGNTPYVGSGASASRLMMDKVATKVAVRAAGLPTPADVRVSSRTAPIPPDLGFPLILKPNRQGSSVGVTRVCSPEDDWQQALTAAFAVTDDVIAEQYIAGREITVGLLHGRALPVVEIIPPGGRIFDEDAKYAHKHGHTQYLCPPMHVPLNVCRQARELAVTAWEVLGAEDLLRVDFIVDDAGTPWFLEANSIPGFTATSLLPMAARQAGIPFPELCARLVRVHVSG